MHRNNCIMCLKLISYCLFLPVKIKTFNSDSKTSISSACAGGGKVCAEQHSPWTVVHNDGREVIQAAFGAAVLRLRVKRQKTLQISTAPTITCNKDVCCVTKFYRKYRWVFIPPTSSISCLGLVRETQRRYQPCFSDMLSSEIVSSVSIAPIGLKNKYTDALEEEAELSARHQPTGGLGVGLLTAELSFPSTSHCNLFMLIRTFGSFWIQNFLVDFCFFLHLWHIYSSVSSSSSRSVKLRRQSKKERDTKHKIPTQRNQIQDDMEWCL